MMRMNKKRTTTLPWALKWLVICPAVFLLGILTSTISHCGEPQQEPLQKDVLTLQDCIEYALQHHSSVLSSEKEVLASNASVRQARAGYLPRLTVSTDYNKSGYEGEQVGTGFRRVGTFTNEQTTIGFSETLYDGGRTRLAIKQAEANRQIALANLDVTRYQRVLSVTQAYFNVLRAQRMARIASETVEQAQKQVEMIQARIDTGDVAKVDIFPAQVQLANAKLQKLQAENSVRVAINTLRNAMGMDKGPDFKLAEVEEPSFTVPPLEDCIAFAVANRPEVARAEAQVETARAALSYANSQLLPVPSASVSYDRGIAGGGYDSQWSIGLGVRLNVFDAGSARAEVKVQRARLDSSLLVAEQVRKDIATEVEEAYLNLTNAFERLSASKSNVELAKTNLEVANAKYEQGLAIPLEIVTAQVSYANAQADYAQALYDCYIARAQLDKAMGRRGW